MSELYHDPIPTSPKQPVNASVVESRLAQLDAAIVAAVAQAQLAQDAVINAGTAATLADGAALAGQKVVTVDDATVFVAGATVEYALVGGVFETNTVASVDSPTQITLHTNIGTGGIANNGLLAVVPVTYANLKAGTYNVLDYGADRTGAADSTAAIQAAINAAGNGVVYLPGGRYKLDGSASLDMSGLRTGVTLQGEHQNAVVLDWYGSDGNIIDCVHSAYCHFNNLLIQPHAGYSAEVGILLGRNASGNSAGCHTFENVIVQGNYTKAAVYSISSEENHFLSCRLNTTGGATAYAYYHSDSNDLSITSSCQTLTALADNATVVQFTGGSATNWTPTTGGPVMHFNDVTNLILTGLSLHADGTPTALVTLAGLIRCANIQGMRQEGTPSYGIHVTGTLSESVVSGNYLAGSAAAIYGANGSTAQYSQFLANVGQATYTYDFATVLGSTIDLRTLNSRVRTAAKQNSWLNANTVAGYPSITGGIGNILYGYYNDAGNPRMVKNDGGVWLSNLGWGIEGASTAATMGTLVKAVTVYDQSGNVVGYVPVYDAIAS